MPELPIHDLDHVLENTSLAVWQALAGTRLFITGGTGFVGTWLVESLLHASNRQHLDIGVVLLTRDPERFRLASPHVAAHPRVELLRGQVSDFEFPAGEFPFVIHAATERQREPSPEQPCGSFDLDIAGTRHILEFARTCGARRLLFTSSGAVYGKQPPELSHVTEEHTGAPAPTDTASAYGQAKRISEYLCVMYARQYGFTALISRLFAFVGPRLPLDAHYAVGNFIGDVLNGRPIRIQGDGTPYRSYLYAADLAVWLWTILVRGTSAYPYNVGSAEAVSIAELARAVAQAGGKPVEIETAARAVPGSLPPRYVPSIERAFRELGLRALVPLDEGIRRTCRWAAAH